MTVGETEGAQPFWFTGGGHDAPAGQRLAVLLDRPGILGVPGAHDGLSGLLARKAGFECLYVSGAALSASMGLPDLGVMTMEELCGTTRILARAAGLPLIVDGGSPHGRVRPEPDPPSTHPPVTYPPVTEPPWPTGIDYGPTHIDAIQAQFVEEWRPLVSVWFRSEHVDRVLAIIECESSGRWN